MSFMKVENMFSQSSPLSAQLSTREEKRLKKLHTVC